MRCRRLLICLAVDRLAKVSPSIACLTDAISKGLEGEAVTNRPNDRQCQRLAEDHDSEPVSLQMICGTPLLANMPHTHPDRKSGRFFSCPLSLELSYFYKLWGHVFEIEATLKTGKSPGAFTGLL